LTHSQEAGLKLQIDLVIDRNDGVIDLCEMKYSNSLYTIDKAYAEKLTSRKEAFLRGTGTKKTVHLVMVTAAGLKRNAYSHIIQNALTLSDLWTR
jgi:predicted methyltransferase MtxX (methanogen marker protein 4)